MSDPLDELPDAVLVLDARRRVVHANRSALELLGFSRDELVGARADDVLKPRGLDGREVWADDWSGGARLRTVTTVPEQSVQVRKADGRDIGVAVTGRYRRTAEGDLTGLVLVLRPTRRRDLQAASGIEVVSIVSHELRAPLTSVKGFTSLMINRWDRLSDEQKLEMVRQVHVDADRVTRLITELLDISRLETGRLRLRRQMLDLAPVIDKVVGDVRHLYPELDPVLEVPQNLPAVYADPDKIVQVLTNLLENTCKYAEGRGVRLAAAVEPDGTSVGVSVSDAGPGIPPEDVQRVFTKFFRSGAGKPTGTGLGLYIAKGIVEAHGGRLWCTSVLGSGTTFTFTLPAGVPAELETAGGAGA